jgi:uncharacterized CHY-type Zn-finger protein
MTGEPTDRAVVSGIEVRGVDVDDETHCAHYASDRDVVAIEFACYGTYYSCHRCHDVLADHDAAVWPRSSFDEPAVLCGACGEPSTIEVYIESPLACPACGTAFNPGCRDHHDRYFEV